MTEEEIKQLNLERVKNYSSLLMNAVWERYKLLSQISVLASALLIVATFNEAIIPLTNCVRTLLVIFLLLMPISLIGYLLAIHRAEQHAIKRMSVELSRGNGNLIDIVLKWLPYYVVGVISLAVLFIIFIILKGFD